MWGETVETIDICGGPVFRQGNSLYEFNCVFASFCFFFPPFHVE